jgi:ABC-2 type transport system ATP-binding protein
MIELQRLSKRFGSKIAVDDISATIQSGRVTGFLGPNGAGKSTTMRMIMGLDHPSSGSAKVNGKSYAGLGSPLVEVGALLDPAAVQKGRTAYDHLRAVAATHSIPKRRVHEVIGLAGLESVAGKRVAGF